MKQKLIGLIVWILYRSLRLTWRIRYVEPTSMREALKARHPFVMAHWHGDEMCLAGEAGRYQTVTMVSQSKDGAIMDLFFKLNGGRTTRGSSSNGGAQALRNLVTLSKTYGWNTSFAVDGPKGPIYKVKPGVFQFFRLQSRVTHLYVSGVACDKYWRFSKAWNKAVLPKPFSKIVIAWFEFPLDASRDWDPRDPTLAQKLEDALHNSKLQAQKFLSPF